MKYLPLLLLLAVVGLTMPLRADDPAPVPKTEPATLTRQTLRLHTLNYLTLVREPEEGVNAAGTHDLHNWLDLNSPTLTDVFPLVKLGLSPLDVRLRTWQAVGHWLPVSLYVFPVRFPGHFRKTGSATLTYAATAQQSTTPDGEETAYTVKTTFIAHPKAVTEYTYTRFALYGVATANFDHIFDWQTKPFITDTPRVGVGVQWAHAADIPDGVVYDKAHTSLAGLLPTLLISTAVNKDGMTKALQGLRIDQPPQHVRSQGVEISCRVAGGEHTWYVSYVTGQQQ